MKSNVGKEIRVGALIALGFIIIFSAFFVIGGEEGFFKEKYELKAKFANVEGLTIGAPVRLGGVKVGAVDKIGFSPDGEDKFVIVSMSVEAKSFPRIKKDSIARLGSKGLLGDRTVDISVGSPEQVQLVQGEYVATIEAYQIDDIISESGDMLTDVKLTAQNAKEITWKINHGDGTLAQVINDPRMYTNLDSLLVLWTDITRKIQKGDGSFAEFINDPVFYDRLTALLDQSALFMTNINGGQGSLGKLATENEIYDHTDSLLTLMTRILEKMDSGQGTLGQMVNNDEVYTKLFSTLDSLDSLMIDIRKHPKKYVKLSLF